MGIMLSNRCDLELSSSYISDDVVTFWPDHRTKIDHLASWCMERLSLNNCATDLPSCLQQIHNLIYS